MRSPGFCATKTQWFDGKVGASLPTQGRTSIPRPTRPRRATPRCGARPSRRAPGAASRVCWPSAANWSPSPRSRPWISSSCSRSSVAPRTWVYSRPLPRPKHWAPCDSGWSEPTAIRGSWISCWRRSPTPTPPPPPKPVPRSPRSRQNVESDRRAKLPPENGSEPDDFEAEFQDEVTLPDSELAQRHWELLKPQVGQAGRLRRSFEVDTGLTGDVLTALDMESRWEISLRARFSGAWSGSPLRLERFPQQGTS